MYADKLCLGFASRGDVIVSSMQAKAEASKTATSIKPGDLLILEEAANVSTVSKTTATNTCCIYGVAVIGIQGFTVPVATKGHVIAKLDSAVFTDIKIGEELTCTEGAKKCCCCNVFVVQKLKALNFNGKEADSYELLLR